MSEKDILILAIESSCDETAASVVKNGRTVLSNVISRITGTVLSIVKSSVLGSALLPLLSV